MTCERSLLRMRWLTSYFLIKLFFEKQGKGHLTSYLGLCSPIVVIFLSGSYVLLDSYLVVYIVSVIFFPLTDVCCLKGLLLFLYLSFPEIAV